MFPQGLTLGNHAKALDLGAATQLLGLFGDPTRVRIVALCAQHELAVGEIASVLGVAQSRVSTHLARLRDAGVVADRREGASTFYRLRAQGMPPAARELWTLVAATIDDSTLKVDAEHAAAALRKRQGGLKWPESVAGEMERHYSPGRTWEAMTRGLLGLVRLGDVLDVGAGDGTLAALLLPRAQSVTLLDVSARMIEAAKTRLQGAKNARFAVSDAAQLPFADESFDEVLLFNVLTCVADPGAVLSEVARVLRPGGGVTVTVLDRHDHLDGVTRGYGHVRTGLRPAELRRSLSGGGLEVSECGISSRERREPYFQVVTAFATKRSADKRTSQKASASKPVPQASARARKASKIRSPRR